MKANQKTSGFTLFELLLVMVVLGILTSIAVSPMRNWQNTVKVNQAAEQFARDLEKQRFNVKQTNTSRTITIQPTAGTYTIGTNIIKLPTGTKIALGTNATGSVTFYPPYGTTISSSGVAAPNIQSYTISLTGNNSYSRTVNVVGLIGKVVVR